MKLNVSPTRMELMKLKVRTALAKRGHKLLKDKLDGLIQRFLKLIKDYHSLKDEADKTMHALFNKLVIASALTPSRVLGKITTFDITPLLLVANRINIMGVKVTDYELEKFEEKLTFPFSDTDVPAELYLALQEFYQFLPQFIKIANIGHAIEKIALAIIEIKRRVNALEYILIPELESTSKYIRMKLAEHERSTLVTLMKIKDIVRAKK
ncbi:MAG: V-type ATP synthase subunit D [Candidatus Margulisbacteria bacterium]|nr:V-type ATP synthase subunit D [Candidatus Margulisiibacteriota bacterium]MBU1021408.1 V-type ATP synthase subunit D [Candidatus Margulisiibacteriota bacterium]MBU1728329.1 V-type ATP synthase subunit D [Candidatus Margulisiibacteriota bacterium]MBU1955928.1 V-type ATP synthase subunit D [Candidatus Margulisiibacteriota bacterium]